MWRLSSKRRHLACSGGSKIPNPNYCLIRWFEGCFNYCAILHGFVWIACRTGHGSRYFLRAVLTDLNVRGREDSSRCFCPLRPDSWTYQTCTCRILPCIFPGCADRPVLVCQVFLTDTLVNVLIFLVCTSCLASRRCVTTTKSSSCTRPAISSSSRWNTHTTTILQARTTFHIAFSTCPPMLPSLVWPRTLRLSGAST